ncbi:hypothetical protein TNCV_3467421 [Trichonephila clavipes]|nr:hypothetical protein TNCV_3467421 [Trichonephila clavipes]
MSEYSEHWIRYRCNEWADPSINVRGTEGRLAIFSTTQFISSSQQRNKYQQPKLRDVTIVKYGSNSEVGEIIRDIILNRIIKTPKTSIPTGIDVFGGPDTHTCILQLQIKGCGVADLATPFLTPQGIEPRRPDDEGVML